MKYKNIAVSGKIIASGSTTLAWELAKKLGWRFHTAGEVFRQYCQERGWPIERYKDIPEEIDREVDEKAKEILEKEEGIIYEGWLAGWIAKDLPHVFRILCVAPLEVRIKRFAQRERLTQKEAKKRILSRDKTTIEKHQQLYQIEDQFDENLFHLVLETDKMTPQEEVKAVLEKMGYRP